MKEEIYMAKGKTFEFEDRLWAMVAIEKENVELKGVLPKNYARPELDKHRLGELIDMFSFKVGDKESRAKDVLGRGYEYFLGDFASAEGTFVQSEKIVEEIQECKTLMKK